jgi:hypothetical protein
MLLCFVFQFVLQGPIAKTMSACSMLQRAKILPSLPPNYEYGKASASGSWTGSPLQEDGFSARTALCPALLCATYREFRPKKPQVYP